MTGANIEHFNLKTLEIVLRSAKLFITYFRKKQTYVNYKMNNNKK